MVRLFIGGLPADVSDSDLRSRFIPFGKVVSIDIAPQKTHVPAESASATPACRGFAHVEVEFKDKGASAKCIASYNGCKWRGHVLRVELAKEHYTVKLQREWEQNMAGEAPTNKGSAGPSVLKADELNTQLGQLRLVHSRHKSKIVQIDLGDRSKVRTIFPPPKPIPLAALSWEPISNQSSFLYRQRAADEAAERLAARRKRAAEAAAAAAASAAADKPDDPSVAAEGSAPAVTGLAALVSHPNAAAKTPPVPRSIGVVCFDSDQERGPAVGAADMDLDRFGSGSDDEGPGPQAEAREVVNVTAPIPLGVPAVPPVLPLAGPKKKKSARKRASSEHDMILQRQAMKALKRLGRLGKDMDVDEGAVTGGERVLSMAVSQSSSSSSERGGHSSSGNLPDDDSSEQDEEEQEPEDERRLHALSGQRVSTSAHYAATPPSQPAALVNLVASLSHEHSSPDPPPHVPPPSRARKEVMLAAAAGAVSDPEPGAKQSSIAERRAAAKATQLKRSGAKLKSKQKHAERVVPDGSDSRPYDADTSGEDHGTPAHSVPTAVGVQGTAPQAAAAEAGPSFMLPHLNMTDNLDTAVTPQALHSVAPDDDTPMTQHDPGLSPAARTESPAGIGWDPEASAGWQLPSTQILAALDLASLLGDAAAGGAVLPGVSGWLSSETLTSPALGARRMGRSRSGGSTGRESRESIMPVTQLGQQFMRSGSEEELRSNWQAQRDGLAADYKRKRRAAMKASMTTSHKAQRRK